MPDTAAYLNLGVVIVTGILGLYGVSLWLRLRNTERDAQTLNDLAE